MRVGTKSILFGAHCAAIHPIAVLVAWVKLYGFPRDPRLILSFVVHDWGYWQKESMDGPQGDRHVELGGRIMDVLCGARWGSFVRRHSRYWCQRYGEPYSRLCVADKLAFVITPAWLYLPMTYATGELDEYMAVADGQHAGGKFTNAERLLLQSGDARLWLKGLKSYTARWVEEHRSEGRDARTGSGEVLKKLRLAILAR
ncbi:MAG TPA: hypothetical protein VFZ08_04395 [Terriglobia bacterium]|nr:hypothetical protein [Terriglobia bacterium]